MNCFVCVFLVEQLAHETRIHTIHLTHVCHVLMETAEVPVLAMLQSAPLKEEAHLLEVFLTLSYMLQQQQQHHHQWTTL